MIYLMVMSVKCLELRWPKKFMHYHSWNCCLPV